jgi:CheY-like chemotaxis protein
MTDGELLTLALHGGEAEWTELHKLCLDRPTAERLHRILNSQADTPSETKEAWIGLLEEMHPDTIRNLDGRAGRLRLRILCAEDHEQICELLKRVLTQAGHDVACAYDGGVAWKMLAHDPTAFDVVITDHQMPEMTGLELVQRLRRTNFSGRIIVHSGNMTPELEAMFLALQVDRIVRKTVRPEFITALVAGFKWT